jgi:hypothetical protein
VVAVAVNGVIGAITRSYVDGSDVALLAIVEPTYFVDGVNRIELLELTEDGELSLVATDG